MRAFDAVRLADARRRIDLDIRDLVTYALAVAEPEATATLDYPTTARWAGPIGMEDELTGDGRSIDGGAIQWDISPDYPAPMRFVLEDVGAHDGAVTVGNIETVERRDGGVIWGEGDFDMGSEYGREAYRMVLENRQTGVSMDMDDVSFEVRVAAELFAEWNEPFPEDGEVEVPTTETDSEGRVTVVTINSDDEVMVTTSARLRAATIVAVPAFSSARIHVVPPEDDDDDASPAGSDELAVVDVSTSPLGNALAQAQSDALVAAAAPLAPPAAWFDLPHLDGPTALVVTKDGRVYGHIALWGTCHVSHTSAGKCITPPNSNSGYAWFHTGALETSEGDLLAVGHLTMGTGHAADTLTPAETMAHYDNTGRVAADVRAHEDQWGIVVAGGLRPGLTPEQVREFRAAPISGDWRRVGGGLELLAGLSVNVPGFGVPRPHGRIKADTLTSLVASGIVVNLPESTVERLSAGDVAYLRAFIDKERRADLDRLAARRNRVKVAQFARRRKG